VVFLAITQSSLVGGYKQFEGMRCLHPYTENGDSGLEVIKVLYTLNVYFSEGDKKNNGSEFQIKCCVLVCSS
jgi:hypothetical protein